MTLGYSHLTSCREYGGGPGLCPVFLRGQGMDVGGGGSGSFETSCTLALVSWNFPCCRADFYPKKRMPSYQDNQLIRAKSLTEPRLWDFHADPSLGDLVHRSLSWLVRLPYTMEQGALTTQGPPSSVLEQNSGISKSDVGKTV